MPTLDRVVVRTIATTMFLVYAVRLLVVGYFVTGLVIAVALWRRDSRRREAIAWFAIWCAVAGYMLVADARRPPPPQDPTLPMFPNSPRTIR